MSDQDALLAQSSSLFEAGFGRALMEAHDVMMLVESATGTVQEIYSSPSFTGLLGTQLPTHSSLICC